MSSVEYACIACGAQGLAWAQGEDRAEIRCGACGSARILLSMREQPQHQEPETVVHPG